MFVILPGATLISPLRGLYTGIVLRTYQSPPDVYTQASLKELNNLPRA